MVDDPADSHPEVRRTDRPRYFEPGQRTGRFRLGKDELIANEQAEGRISVEDYAIVLVGELEEPRHRRQRFSVGY